MFKKNSYRLVAIFLFLSSCQQTVLAAHMPQIAKKDFPPLPRVNNPYIFQAPAGGFFNFVTCKKNNLVFSMAETTVPPGMGPLPHIHHYTNEWFYAPEGGFTVFASETIFDNVEKPPSKAQGNQTTVALVPLNSQEIMYGPKFNTHGFINHDSMIRPLTIVWKPDPISPDFPYKDGGIREYFEAISQKVSDPKHPPAISPENIKLLVSEAPKYGINQSSYFLQYINRVEPQIPPSFHHPENMKDLNEILSIVKEYNAGSKEVTCF